MTIPRITALFRKSIFIFGGVFLSKEWVRFRVCVFKGPCGLSCQFRDKESRKGLEFGVEDLSALIADGVRRSLSHLWGIRVPFWLGPMFRYMPKICLTWKTFWQLLSMHSRLAGHSQYPRVVAWAFNMVPYLLSRALMYGAWDGIEYMSIQARPAIF